MSNILPLLLLSIASRSMHSSPNTNPMYIAMFRDIIAGPNGYTLPPLPYAYNALEPFIDERTMMIHHDKHHQTYVNNLNTALNQYPELYDLTLEQLLANSNNLPEDIRTAVVNNGGGHYNHTFFWNVMSPDKGGTPTGNLASAIDREFGSFEDFKKAFTAEALKVFGSGWTWLLKAPSGKLQIVSTSNQGTPIPLGLDPIIVIDLWEHAYYLKHQNVRADYINDWFNTINWDLAESLYD